MIYPFESSERLQIAKIDGKSFDHAKLAESARMA
jgi:hypothetical protein